MKVHNNAALSPLNAAPPLTAQNTVPNAATDFTALLMQLLGNTPTAAPTSLPAAVSEVLHETDRDSNAEEDPATTELAMLMAALTPVQLDASRPVTSVLPQSASSALNGLQATATPLESLTSGVTEELQELLGSGQDTQTDQSTAGTEARPQTLSLDPLKDTRLPTAEPTIARQLHSTVGTPQWSEELGTQVQWLTERGHQTASLRLSPEHLGPVEVKISIKDDQASVWFGAANADTRAAIESALPRLREMLADQGLSLSDAGVFREPPKQQQTPDNGNVAQADALDSPETVKPVTVSINLIDAYA